MKTVINKSNRLEDEKLLKKGRQKLAFSIILNLFNRLGMHDDNNYDQTYHQIKKESTEPIECPQKNSSMTLKSKIINHERVKSSSLTEKNLEL